MWILQINYGKASYNGNSLKSNEHINQVPVHGYAIPKKRTKVPRYEQPTFQDPIYWPPP